MYLAAARGKIDMPPHASRENLPCVFPMLIFPLDYALSNPHTHIYTLDTRTERSKS